MNLKEKAKDICILLEIDPCQMEKAQKIITQGLIEFWAETELAKSKKQIEAEQRNLLGLFDSMD